MKHVYVILLLAIAATSCSLFKHEYSNYSYELVTEYESKNGTDSIISPYYYYRGYLIELILEKKTDVTIYNNRMTTLITFDTIALQIINPHTQKYAQPDQFKTNATIVEKGLYKNSPIGLKLGEFTNEAGNSDNKETNQAYRDTSIYNNYYKYTCTKIKDKSGKDSITSHIYMLNTPNVFTPFMIGGLQTSKSGMTLAGFDFVFPEQGTKISRLISRKRPLSSYELSVCEHIYNISSSLINTP